MLDGPQVAELVRRASKGERGAWDELVEGLGGLVWAVIRGHGLYGADAADVSQTTWLRLVEHLDRVREPERTAAWLATTARHECLRTLRRMGRQAPTATPPEIPDPSAPDPERLVVDEEGRRRLLAALEQIPERCRVLLRLMIADPPLSYDDIAATLDMPKGSIGPTRQRCLVHVRNAMGVTGDA